jgi:hypothetical protein
VIDSNFSHLTTVLLVASLMPALALSIALRPRPLRYILRGGESAICVAWSLDLIRRLVMIATGSTVLMYPGPIVGIMSVTILGMSSLLLWVRVAQVARHRANTKLMKAAAAEHIARQERGGEEA